jgi:hypothetical protein
MSDLMPDPSVWPVCHGTVKVPECGVPYVYRRAMTAAFVEDEEGKRNCEMTVKWLWGRDCKHKNGNVRLHDKNGEIES